jgi:hypothetical protein
MRGSAPSSVMAAGSSEMDVLNFGLNLEYLEGIFYSFVTQGADLPLSLTAGSGAITGNPPAKVAFANQQTTDRRHSNIARAFLAVKPGIPSMLRA